MGGGALWCCIALSRCVCGMLFPRTSLGVGASWRPQALLKNELETMRLVSLHPGVPTLHRSYDDKDHTMFVMDFVRGGPLLDQIVQQRTFTENDARATFHSALRTLNFMAKIGVVHRDLKVRRSAGFCLCAFAVPPCACVPLCCIGGSSSADVLWVAVAVGSWRESGISGSYFLPCGRGWYLRPGQFSSFGNASLLTLTVWTSPLSTLAAWFGVQNVRVPCACPSTP